MQLNDFVDVSAFDTHLIELFQVPCESCIFSSNLQNYKTHKKLNKIEIKKNWS